jgi:hypothetical protein
MSPAVVMRRQLQDSDRIVQVVQGVLWSKKVIAGRDKLIEDMMMQSMDVRLGGGSVD